MQMKKKAQYIASKLIGHAMDVYLRMSDEDKKDPEKVTAELLKEFERGQLNREEAIAELDKRRRLPNESIDTYAFKIIELVKLSYPSFAADVRKSLAKDYFVRGLSSAMQLALKSAKDYATMDIKTVAKETVRLELAGVNAKMERAVNSAEVNSCDDMVDAIAGKVLEKLGGLRVSDEIHTGVEKEVDSINRYNNNNRRNNYRGRGGRNGYRNRGQAYQNRPSRKCRSCQSTDHLIKDCPTRFCQACGGRGHDQYNPSCPNFQL